MTYTFEDDEVDSQEPTTYSFEEPAKEKKLEAHPEDSRIAYMRENGVSEADIQEFLAEDPLREFQGSKETFKELPRGVLSGATAGYSELIHPSFVPKGHAGEATKMLGSLAPITKGAKLLSYPLKKAAEKSPIIAKGLQSFADLVGLSTAGGIYGALEESAEKTKEAGEFVAPTLDDVLDHGLTWAALDAGLKALGWTGRFAKALAQKALSTGKTSEQLMKELASQVGTDNVAAKAISILEEKPLELIEREIKLSAGEAPGKTEQLAASEFANRTEERGVDLRTRKIEKQEFDKLNTGEASTPEPYLPAAFEVETEKVGEEALNSDLNKRIESVSQRATTEKELGENIQKDLEKTIEKEKRKTDAEYEIARVGEEGKFPKTKSTANAIVEEIKKIEAGGIELTPEGYAKAKSDLLKMLTDIGYGVETNEAGQIIRAIENERKSLSQLIEVKRRGNNIVNYDLLDTSAKDFLKNPLYNLRQNIRTGYGPKSSKARRAFEKAEQMHGEFAEKKNRKIIRSARLSETPESLAKKIRTPSGLADIKQVSSPEQFAQIERELLEYMRGQNQERVAALYRELRPSLTEDTRSITEQIIDSKAPKASPTRKVAQRQAIQDKALDSIAEATISGKRPKVALDLWKTTEGQQLIKQALENNPNKAEVLKYLHDQSFKDFAASVVEKDGKINFTKLNEMLKDPATLANLRLEVGEEGVSFLKNLEQMSDRIEKNASYLERTIAKSTAPERKKINDELEKQYKKRIEQIKEKKSALTPEEKIFQENYNTKQKQTFEEKRSVKGREESEQALREKGKERFKKSREKREAISKQEMEAAEAKERSTLLYKFDDLMSSYGFKAKGILAALGVLKIGTAEGLLLATGYEVISRIVKNKTLRDAVKKASATPKDNFAIISSLIAIEDIADKSIE